MLCLLNYSSSSSPVFSSPTKIEFLSELSIFLFSRFHSLRFLVKLHAGDLLCVGWREGWHCGSLRGGLWGTPGCSAVPCVLCTPPLVLCPPKGTMALMSACAVWMEWDQGFVPEWAWMWMVGWAGIINYKTKRKLIGSSIKIGIE